MLLPQWSKRRKTRLLGIVVLCLCWVTFAGDAQADEGSSISGTLLMLDDKTPHVACVVQVVIPSAIGDAWCQSFMENRKYKIENDIPYIDMDFG
jgi:hypothetical protein